MTDLDNVLRKAINDRADAVLGDVPTSINGIRVLNSTRVSHRRKLALLPVAFAVMALLVIVSLLPRFSGPEATPVASAADVALPSDNAGDAFIVSTFDTATRTRFIYDPVSHEYRKTPTGARAISPSLRYAVFSTPTATDDVYVYSIREVATDKVVYETELRSRAVKWSNDGKWVAFANSVGDNMEDRFISKVDLLDVTTGARRSLDIDESEWQATEFLGWSVDSSEMYFDAVPGVDGDAKSNAHMRVSLSGDVKVVDDNWPFDYYAVGLVPGKDSTLLAPRAPDGTEWMLLDLRSGKVLDRFNAKANFVPEGGDPLWAVVGPYTYVTVHGRSVSIVDVRTGTSTVVSTLPAEAIAITLGVAPTGATPPAVVFPRPGL